MSNVNDCKKMKKFFIALAFTLAYAIFLSIGFECLLRLVGLYLAVMLDGTGVLKEYPRFLPFCLIVGFSALVALVSTFSLNLKVSERFGFTKKILWIQMIIAVIISIPMIIPWGILFVFLQNTF